MHINTIGASPNDIYDKLTGFLH